VSTAKMSSTFRKIIVPSGSETSSLDRIILRGSHSSPAVDLKSPVAIDRGMKTVASVSRNSLCFLLQRRAVQQFSPVTFS